MLLIDDLLLWGPLKGIVALARKLHEIAEAETTDDVATLRARLQEAQMHFEMDEITEKEYLRREEEVLTALERVRATGS